MVSRSDIPKFASNNRTQGTAEENKAVVQGIIVYIGTWSVDEASKTLTIDIDASSFPNDNGSRWKRSITSLTDDEVRWTNQNSSSGTVIEAAWKRVK
jgi:Lipocalin-like domain